MSPRGLVGHFEYFLGLGAGKRVRLRLASLYMTYGTSRSHVMIISLLGARFRLSAW